MLNEKTAPKRLLKSIDKWAGYYRANPHRYAKDMLHLDLRLFQKMLLVMMFWSVSFVFIASRGLGKTFLCAVFCVIRCVLYPGSKIVIASGTRGQAINVLEKVMLELVPRSPVLNFEIDHKQTKINGTNAQIVFKNGSFMKVVTASDTSRGNRANILIIDEFRLVSKDVVDTVLKKFITSPRMPSYSKLSPEERQREIEAERNKTLYLSSAYFSDSWAYEKCVSTFEMMLDDTKRHLVCGFPYQLALKENLLTRADVEDQMAEADFSEVKWSMEMGAEWFGAAEDAWFDFESIAKNRRIQYAMLPDRLSSKIKQHQNIAIQKKAPDEIRILSVDIALMSSSKHNNDATAICLNRMVPTKAGRYTSNIVYTESVEGMHTEDQALLIRKYFDEFECDYLVLDAQGVGGGVYDCLVRNISDPETGEIYPAISCCNNPEMAARCADQYAPKVIWAIKASAQFNSQCAFLLREGFRSGRCRLLVTEYDGEALLKELAGYNALTPMDQLRLQAPYIETTLLINELVKLNYEQTGSNVRLYERSGMRKDRYSSLSYNFYVASQLESQMGKKTFRNSGEAKMFIVRAPKTSNTERTISHGKNYQSWRR